MLEFPEVVSRASEIRQVLAGAVVEKVYPPSKPHKFCWWNGDPASYPEKLEGRRLVSASGSGSFLTLAFEGDCFLSVNDGVVLTYLPREAVSGDYQLMLCFSEGRCLVFTVSMYGGICLHDENYENPYYLKSIEAVSPLSDEFPAYFRKTLAQSSRTLSAKAFLATKQRFPGIGNGVLQDILYDAGIHPKRKLSTMDSAETERLLASMVRVLREMAEQGGRDTEKTLFGGYGGYRTKMSKNTLSSGCPRCGGVITKEAYLGGSVYYCPVCQPQIGKE